MKADQVTLPGSSRSVQVQSLSSTQTYALFPCVIGISPPQTTFIDLPFAFALVDCLFTDFSLTIRKSALCLLFVFKNSLAFII